MKLIIVLSLAALSAAAQTNLIIRSGGSLVCGTNLTVSAGAVVLEEGASCLLNGATLTCEEMRVDAGAAVTVGADSTLAISDLWVNDSGFVKPDGLEMPKAVSLTSEANMATGVGDTDGDGISDRGEGSFDVNSNRIADFIDASSASACDQIPFDWLVTHGLATDGSADGSDPDDDGASNLAEYHAMTDPGDPDSVLRITSLSVNEAADAVTVTWQSVDTRSYELEYGASVAGVGSGTSGTVAGEIRAHTTSVAVDASGAFGGFFRVTVNP